MSGEIGYSSLATERHGRSISDLQGSTYKGDASIFIAEKTLMIAEKQTVFRQFAMPAKHPQGSSQTIQFTRFDRLALPTAPLTDGTSPSNTSMSISTVLAVQDEWGAVITITDQAELSVAHGPLAKAIDLMGYQVSETIDRECFEVLFAGTTVQYGYNGSAYATARTNIGSTHVITKGVVSKARAKLATNGAHRFGGGAGTYIGICDPSITEDIVNQSDFIDAKKYRDAELIYNSEIGVWGRIRWVESNTIPYLMRMDASSNVAVTPASCSAVAGTTGTVATGTYYFKIEAYDSSSGHLKEVSAEASQAVTLGEIWTLTLPATSGYKYRAYVGSASGSLYEVTSGQTAASTAVTLDAAADIPSSGDEPAATPATTIKVHFTFVMGQEAFAFPELMSVETFVTPKQPSDSDPLVQRRKVGWKCFFKPVICNNDFMLRIESASAYDV